MIMRKNNDQPTNEIGIPNAQRHLNVLLSATETLVVLHVLVHLGKQELVHYVTQVPNIDWIGVVRLSVREGDTRRLCTTARSDRSGHVERILKTFA
jgi:predicted MarR family transcription regulator